MSLVVAIFDVLKTWAQHTDSKEAIVSKVDFFISSRCIVYVLRRYFAIYPCSLSFCSQVRDKNMTCTTLPKLIANAKFIYRSPYQIFHVVAARTRDADDAMHSTSWQTVSE